MNDLAFTIRVLSEAFVDGVFEALRGATLADIGNDHARPRAQVKEPTKVKAKRAGRLKRRTPEDIAKFVGEVVALVGKRGPLTSEQIKEALSLDTRELPRILQQGLADKLLKKAGHHRSTVYSKRSNLEGVRRSLQSGKKAAKPSSKKTAKPPSKKSAKKTVKKIAKKTAKKIAKTAKKPAKKAVKKPTSKKPAKKAPPKKQAPKTATPEVPALG